MRGSTSGRAPLAALLLLLGPALASGVAVGASLGDGPFDLPPDSPAAVVAAEDGKQLFIACATADQVAFFDLASTSVTERIDVPASPLGLALSKDGARLYVACAAPTSTVCVIDVAQRRIIDRIGVGHTAMALVLSPDGQRLYVCNRFDNDVSVIDLVAHREVGRIPVEREPVAAAVTPDGRFLFVANHLHAGRSDHLHAQAVVSLIDTATGQVARSLPLSLGATLLRGVAVSPDGRFAAVTFVHARFWLSTTEVAMGRMNANAVVVLDLARFRQLGIVFLDQHARGAANPWAITWTPDSRTIVVSLAGTHEVCLIDAPVDADPANFFSPTLGQYFTENGRILPPPAHPVRVRQRISLPGNGPRALAVSGSTLYVANYFTDDLSRIELSASPFRVETLPLGPVREPSLVRRGERLFNDARLCIEGWQSCASCHDTDGRMDGFNWDLLNDGLQNPKNTKSLLWAHQTPPAMSLGVRSNAAVAVRAGIHHILFTDQDEEVPAAIDAYLQSLAPVSGPHRVNGGLSCAAERGQRLFLSARTGCAECHPPPLFTDLASYDVGSARAFGGLWEAKAADRTSDRFDTPTLVELWRTAPYLHDGSAATLRDVLTTCNANDRHGRTSNLTKEELDDLVEYLLSL